MWVWQVDTAHHIMVEVHYPCPLFNTSNGDTYEVCTCTIILYNKPRSEMLQLIQLSFNHIVIFYLSLLSVDSTCVSFAV